MKKALLLLLGLCLLALPAWGQNSADTAAKYIEVAATYTDAAADVDTALEVPSWAYGAVFFMNATACAACDFNIDLLMYWPTSSNKVVLDVDVVTGIDAVEWNCGVVAGRDPTGWNNCTGSFTPLPAGTIVTRLDRAAGTVSGVLYVRWIGNPHR